MSISVKFIIFLMSMLQQLSNIFCQCDGRNGCCSGYSWNEDFQNCTRCELGFYGRSCERKCPYPYYGVDCMAECTCLNITCHFAFGCPPTTDSVVTVSEERWTEEKIGSITPEILNATEHVSLTNSQYIQSTGIFLSHNTLIIIISATCVALFIIVITAVLVSRHLFMKSVYSVKTRSAECNIPSLPKQTSQIEELQTQPEEYDILQSDQIFKGPANMAIFYNKENETYSVEIKSCKNNMKSKIAKTNSCLLPCEIGAKSNTIHDEFEKSSVEECNKSGYVLPNTVVQSTYSTVNECMQRDAIDTHINAGVYLTVI